MDIRSLIGLNVRRMRQEKDWSQEALAHEAGMDCSYLSEVENGQKNISVLMLGQIAKALDVEPEALLTRSNKKVDGLKE